MEDSKWKEIREQAAMEALKQAKTEPGKDVAEIESQLLWENDLVKQEFGNDFATLVAFLQNSSRTSSHSSKAENYSSADLEAAGNAETEFMKKGQEELLKKWDSDSELRAEYDGDFEAFKSWCENKHKVKTLNR